MPVRTSLAIVSLFLVAACKPAPAGENVPLGLREAAEARALRDRAAQDSRAYDHVRSLTDEAGSRLAGSPGDAV